MRWRFRAGGVPARFLSVLTCAVIACAAGAAGAAATAGAAAWRVTPVPSPTVPNGSMAAVSCASATACMAVGSQTDAYGNQTPLAETWNGTAWTMTSVPPSPAGTAQVQLDGVACAAANACVAVGSYLERVSDGAVTQVTLPLAESWNGSAWSIQPAPNPNGGLQTELSAVSCSAANACTAVGTWTNGGYTTLPLFERWNGARWTIQGAGPVNVSYLTIADGVSCPSATSCTAVGWYQNGADIVDQPLVAAWNGTAWTQQPTPDAAGASDSSLLAMACTSVSACTATGEATVGKRTEALAESWNGATWAIAAPLSPGPAGNRLNGVACVRGGPCTAVGDASAAGGEPVTLAEQERGGRWSLTTARDGAAAGATTLSGVACRSVASCMAVGSATSARHTVTLAESWNGTRWGIVASPVPAGAFSSRLGGVSCPAANACTAVGSARVGAAVDTLVESWNGTRWTIVPSPDPAGAATSLLSAVTCASPADCVAVGSATSDSATRPLVETWNGMVWAIQATPALGTGVTGALRAVSCTAPDACTATGTIFGSPAVGLAERWNGTAWSLESTPSPAGSEGIGLLSVSCGGSASCFAVGPYDDDGPTISSPMAQRWNGTTWTLQAPPGPSQGPYGVLQGVSCVSAADCTAVGLGDAVGQTTLADGWNGTRWAAEATPDRFGASQPQLGAVSCTAAGCMAVGSVIDAAGFPVPLAELDS